MIWPGRASPVRVWLMTAGLLVPLATGCGSDGLLADGDPTPTTVGATAATVPATPAETTVATVTTTATTAAPLDPTFDAIATRTAMTGEARALLAGSEPMLVERGALGASCPLDIDLSVLGCYGSGRITVLRVTDPRLDGMTETTAAHEMLHAAWASLGDGDRARLMPLLQAAYQRAATPELTERVEAYRASDPTVVDNELHSIIGTEVVDVGPELETYYQRWFSDRAAVVNLAVGARSTFTSLQAQVDDLDARLDDLRARIEAEEGALDTNRVALEARFAELEALKANGQIEEYNAGVDPFNQQVAAYNDTVAAHQALVDEHNSLVAQRNDLAAAYTDLVAQIDTSAQSMPS